MAKSTHTVSEKQREFFDVAEVADLFGVRPITVYRWCRSGRLPSIKIGKAWRISRSVLEDVQPHASRPRLASKPSEGVAMRDVSPATKDLAQRLLRLESGGQLEAEAVATAADRILARLRTRLDALLGRMGYFALLRRALRLAQGEYPLMNSITIGQESDGDLLGLREFALGNGGDPSAVASALAALVAHLFWLLVTFIGEDLTLRLVGEIWPDIAQGAGESLVQGEESKDA
jgi:excisionase family DNA binding protein